jgi:tetratricopeptide (TPR) repeat protein
MENKQKKRFWSKKTSIFAVILATLIIAGIAGGVYYWTQLRQVGGEPTVKQEDVDKSAAAAQQSKSDGALRDEATTALKSNNTAAAQKSYQTAIDSEKTVERKTLLYIDLSGVYYAQGRSQEAFDVMKQADAINADKFLIADWLSRLYEDQQNYPKAAQYYKLAGEWAESKQNKVALDKAYYDEQATRMTRLAEGKK